MKQFRLLITAILSIMMLSVQAQNSRVSDSLALVALYNATDGNNWKNNDNWLGDKPLEAWYGVKTQSTTGRVWKLHLVNNNLRGELPDALVGLDSLMNLQLKNNYLYGHIPSLHLIPFYDSLQSNRESLSSYWSIACTSSL